MDNAQLAELQGKSIAVITEQLPAMDRAALVELAALETAATNSRTTLLSAIDDRLKALDEAELDPANNGEPPPKAPPAAKAEPKAEPKPEPKPWQHPDYAGPLNGEQAAWRVRNIKPVRKVQAK